MNPIAPSLNSGQPTRLDTDRLDAIYLEAQEFLDREEKTINGRMPPPPLIARLAGQNQLLEENKDRVSMLNRFIQSVYTQELRLRPTLFIEAGERRLPPIQQNPQPPHTVWRTISAVLSALAT